MPAVPVLLMIIAAKFLIGSFIGVFVVWLVYRSRFGLGIAIRGALFGGIGFLCASVLAGWAGLHVAFFNGKRMDFAPSGEDLRVRNVIANNEALICLATTSIAALFAGLRLGSRRRVK